MMHWWCAVDALMMPWGCTDDALMMGWWCADDALMMHWWCAYDALRMHWWWADYALMMGWWCTDDALIMRWWCTNETLMMHGCHIWYPWTLRFFKTRPSALGMSDPLMEFLEIPEREKIFLGGKRCSGSLFWSSHFSLLNGLAESLKTESSKDNHSTFPRSFTKDFWDF